MRGRVYATMHCSYTLSQILERFSKQAHCNSDGFRYIVHVVIWLHHLFHVFKLHPWQGVLCLLGSHCYLWVLLRASETSSETYWNPRFRLLNNRTRWTKLNPIATKSELLKVQQNAQAEYILVSITVLTPAFISDSIHTLSNVCVPILLRLDALLRSGKSFWTCGIWS